MKMRRGALRGRAGQLLNNMIKAMGSSASRSTSQHCEVPSSGQSQPERRSARPALVLMRQIAVVKPKVIVASARLRQDVAGDEFLDMQLRGGFTTSNRSVAVPMNGWVQAGSYYHPAFLLRDRAEGEAWKDLQMVMKELG